MKVLFTFFIVILVETSCSERPLVIGHRGTAYVPEETVSAFSMSHAFGADVLELDICLSRDNQLVIIHDLYLDAVTNVREMFPNRNRSNGLHYVIDFDWQEIRQLNVFERRDPSNGNQVFPSRFPTNSIIPFRLLSLNETIELLLGLNKATGRRRELLIEIKKPEYHTTYGRSISKVLIDTLDAYNLKETTDPIILQSFHIEELFHIRQDLKTKLRLFALLTTNDINESSSDYDYYQTETGIRNLSTVVQAIAPFLGLVVNFTSTGEIIGPTQLTKLAHESKLAVYPYTFRKDQFPGTDFQKFIEYFWHEVKIDGFITDHPDVVLQILEANTSTTIVCSAKSIESIQISTLMIIVIFFQKMLS